MPTRHAQIDRLSKRQKEILRLIGQHMQAKEVALKLKIRETTVRTHTEEARRRLGVSTSREAAQLLLDYEQREALLNRRGPLSLRIAELTAKGTQSQHEQDLRSERTLSNGPMDGSGTSLDDARISGKAASDSRHDRNRQNARPVLQSGTRGFQYGRRHRLADRRWALFERRLASIKLWQWFGYGFLAAVTLTASAGALLQGAISMFGIFHELQRHSG